MATIKIVGQTNIRNLKEKFEKTFKVRLQVFDQSGI